MFCVWGIKVNGETILTPRSDNLILNGGFEEFTGKENFEIGKPCCGWIINPAYPSEIQVAASGEARSGLKCLKMRPLLPEEIKRRKLQCHIPGRGMDRFRRHHYRQ